LARTVLFLHSSAGGYGADNQLLALAAGLDPRRYNPLVVLPERGELAPALEEAGVETIARPLAVLRRGLVSPAGLAGTAARLARDRRELGRLARERDAALVHANTSVVVAAQPVARAAGVPCIVHVREIYEGAGPRALWPLLRRRLLRADALACVSQATAAQFGAASHASVIHDGLVRIPLPEPRAGARATLGLPDERLVVAVLGRVSDWKGQDVLARALAEPALAEIGAIGLVAGDAYPGAERHEHELGELADRLGLADRLRLLGFRDDLETVLGAADAIAVPSTRPDPLPNSALEGAAAGLPVIASDHGGLLEIVRHGETGTLVRAGDPRALAAALRALADDPAEARRLGEAAAADVRRRFPLERMLAEVQALYERLLAF
jgi:glycosyltransferase involved in cell wall biosynthesis